MFQPNVSAGRALMVGGGGLFAVMGSVLVDYSGAGPLGCIVAAFVACYGWKAQGWTSEFVSVAEYIDCWGREQKGCLGLGVDVKFI